MVSKIEVTVAVKSRQLEGFSSERRMAMIWN